MSRPATITRMPWFAQLVADLRKALVEKLSFVYSYYVEILGEF